MVISRPLTMLPTSSGTADEHDLEAGLFSWFSEQPSQTRRLISSRALPTIVEGKQLRPLKVSREPRHFSVHWACRLQPEVRLAAAQNSNKTHADWRSCTAGILCRGCCVPLVWLSDAGWPTGVPKTTDALAVIWEVRVTPPHHVSSRASKTLWGCWRFL